MTAVTLPIRPTRLAFAICGRRWQNDDFHEKMPATADFRLRPQRGVAL